MEWHQQKNILDSGGEVLPDSEIKKLMVDQTGNQIAEGKGGVSNLV